MTPEVARRGTIAGGAEVPESTALMMEAGSASVPPRAQPRRPRMRNAPSGGRCRHMAKAAAKSKKRAKPAKGKKHHRGMLDLPKAVETRMAEGRAERESVPLEAHAEWAPSDGRPDPVWVLEEQARTRVPELVPIRHGRMLVSPFTFYRGGAAIMAADLAGTPRTGLHVQLCGDAHLSNFGVFAAPDRRLVFSVNDFDETLPGPFEWDLKRLVASVAVAGRDRGFDPKRRAPAVVAAARSYPHGGARIRGEADARSLVRAPRRRAAGAAVGGGREPTAAEALRAQRR